MSDKMQFSSQEQAQEFYDHLVKALALEAPPMPKKKPVKVVPDAAVMEVVPAAPPTPPPTPFTLAPLTADEWETLSGKGKWDSQVALRGPDLTNSSTIKYFATSIIRYRLSEVMRVGGLVNSTLPFIVIPKGLVPGKHPSFDWAHFIGHVIEAANWLAIPLLPVPWVWYNQEIVLASNPTVVMQVLRNYLNTPDTKARYSPRFLLTLNTILGDSPCE